MREIGSVKKIVFYLIIMTAAFYCIEGLCDILNECIKLPQHEFTIEYGFMKDKELFWRLDPGGKVHNSLGFRDVEFDVKKPKGTFRIICMGDSVTYGMPVKKEETYPKMLAKILRSRYPDKEIESINAGVPGYSSYQGLQWLKHNIAKYQPDVCVLYYGINETAGSINNLADKEQKMPERWLLDLANFLSRFKSYKLINRLTLLCKYSLYHKNKGLVRRVSPQDYKNNLLEINKICEENNTKTLFITNAARYDPQEDFVFTVDEYQPPQGIRTLNAYEIYKRHEKDASRLFADDTRPDNYHFTQEGQDLLAREVAKYLTENSMLFNN